jgi:hypothetical protein
MQRVTTIGLDIAKSVFQVHGVDAAGKVVVPRQLKRVVSLHRASSTAVGGKADMSLTWGIDAIDPIQTSDPNAPSSKAVPEGFPGASVRC